MPLSGYVPSQVKGSDSVPPPVPESLTDIVTGRVLSASPMPFHFTGSSPLNPIKDRASTNPVLFDRLAWHSVTSRPNVALDIFEIEIWPLRSRALRRINAGSFADASSLAFDPLLRLSRASQLDRFGHTINARHCASLFGDCRSDLADWGGSRTVARTGRATAGTLGRVPRSEPRCRKEDKDAGRHDGARSRAPACDQPKDLLFQKLATLSAGAAHSRPQHRLRPDDANKALTKSVQQPRRIF
jgi:hypothetical protein